MADIKQAAQWMKEGKRVKRAFKAPDGYENPDSLEADESGLIKARWLGVRWDNAPCYTSVDSLLADDWELA